MTTNGDAEIDDWEVHWGAYASSAEDNPAQRFRRSLSFALLESGRTPERLLDIGAGQGDLLHAARIRWPRAELTGIELSAAGAEQTRRKVPSALVIRRNLLLDESPSEERVHWATHAVCSEVLEHVDDPVLLLVHARPYLAPGCRIVITVPGGPRSAFDRHIGHRRHYDRDSLADVLAAAGFVDIDAQAAGFPMFNLYKLLVILRGNRVIDDVRGEPSPLARRVMAIFDFGFRFARRRGRLGWQITATAVAP